MRLIPRFIWEQMHRQPAKPAESLAATRTWHISKAAKPEPQRRDLAPEEFSLLDHIWQEAVESGQTEGITRLAPGVYRLDKMSW